nr:alpha-amylase family glycosyl hydrolase [Spirochaetota bacterium]
SYSSFAKPNLMLTNHDLVRFGDLIQRSPHLGYGKENPDYWKRHKAAFSFMASYTGPITIYYGDEIGDEVTNFVNKGDGGYYDDHVSRSSGQISGFDANQENLKNYLTSLMQMRASYQALWKGTRTNLKASANQYADLKTYGSEKIVYCLNTSTSPDTITISQSLTGGSSLRDLSDNSTISANGGSYSIPVSGLSGRFLTVE